MPAAEWLVPFAEAIVEGTPEAIAAARERLRAALGAAAVVDAAAVAANFERMVRIADGTGIALDAPLAMMSVDLREELGVDWYGSAGETPEVGRVKRAVGRLLRPLMPFLMRVLPRLMRLAPGRSSKDA